MNSIRLAKKLPLYFMCFSLFVTIALGSISYYKFHGAMLIESEHVFEAEVAGRSRALENWMESIGTTLLANAANRTTVDAINQFSIGWRFIGNRQTEELQRSYITENRFPKGEKHKLDAAEGEGVYHKTHADFHPTFRTLQQLNDFYDVFLFDTDGNLIYSVFKEADFATNFSSGAYSGSGLGSVFRDAIGGQSGQIYFADFAPYAPSAGAPASFVATPVADAAGSVVGVLAFQVPISRMVSIVNATENLGETGEIFLVADDLTARSPSRRKGEHEILEPLPANEQIQAALAGESRLFVNVPGSHGGNVLAVTGYINFFDAHWALVAEEAMHEVLAPATDTGKTMLVVALILLPLLGLLGWFVGRTITKPISKVVGAVEQIADGDFHADVSGADRKDEIGDIAKALKTFAGKLSDAESAEHERQELQAQQQKVVEALSESLITLSSGDLTQPIQDKFHQDYEQLRQDFNKTVGTLNEALTNVKSVTSNIKNGAHEISQANDELSVRTESQAATLEETAAALEEMTHGVASAADGTKSAEDMARTARDEAEQSGEVMERAVAAMSEIENSSSKISLIVGVIEDIAFQTNLLALNAGVEAARAGDSGRGFAVVAAEVRALAQRSTEAAKEIKDLISSSSAEVSRGVKLVGKAGDALTNIVEQVENVSALMTDIATGSAEQATGLTEINTGVVHLDQVTQQNAAMVEECTAASHSVRTDALMLADLVNRFKISNADNGAGSASSVSKVVNIDSGPNSEHDSGAVDDFHAVPMAKESNGSSGGTPAQQANWKEF